LRFDDRRTKLPKEKASPKRGVGRLTDEPAHVGSAMMCYLADGDGTGGAMDANRFFVWIVFPLMFWAAMISSFLPPNTQVLTMLASLLP
jgi:hypothetical protein